MLLHDVNFRVELIAIFLFITPQANLNCDKKIQVQHCKAEQNYYTLNHEISLLLDVDKARVQNGGNWREHYESLSTDTLKEEQFPHNFRDRQFFSQTVRDTFDFPKPE